METNFPTKDISDNFWDIIDVINKFGDKTAKQNLSKIDEHIEIFIKEHFHAGIIFENILMMQIAEFFEEFLNRKYSDLDFQFDVEINCLASSIIVNGYYRPDIIDFEDFIKKEYEKQSICLDN